MPYSNIDKPNKYFNTILYTGNGSTQSITSLDFKPDWVWIKNRSNALSHCITDAVRGTNLQLASNSTGADSSATDGITSFNSNGFSLGAGTLGYSSNTNAHTYASWNWLGANTTVSNTSGSITSTVSANTTSGFSIVSYTGNGSSGATVGHGLGIAPKMVIVKRRSLTEDWFVNHTSASATAGSYLKLNSTQAVITGGAGVWNNTNPSSTVVTLGTDTGTNGNGSTYIAYCFAEVKGYSKFGSYTGNGSTDGTFVYTGFKPAFILLKRTDSTSHWSLFDTTRNTYNVSSTRLYPDLTNAEDSNLTVMDILSNGFKFRDTNVQWNTSGGAYIYMCFASNPFVTSSGIPTTAR
jgi:hypothetical protein